jgi:hypothetical protein
MSEGVATEMMTPKEIEDKIIVRLTDGKGRAGLIWGTRFICQYRDSTGKGCAIGCLIPDELYDPNMEGPTPACIGTIDDRWQAGERAGSYMLANALNGAGIPATDGVRSALIEWQARHDSILNWNGNVYVGPLDRIM